MSSTTTTSRPARCRSVRSLNAPWRLRARSAAPRPTWSTVALRRGQCLRRPARRHPTWRSRRPAERASSSTRSQPRSRLLRREVGHRHERDGEPRAYVLDDGRREQVVEHRGQPGVAGLLPRDQHPSQHVGVGARGDRRHPRGPPQHGAGTAPATSTTGSGLIASPHVRQTVSAGRPQPGHWAPRRRSAAGIRRSRIHRASPDRGPHSTRPVRDCGRQRPYVRLVNLDVGEQPPRLPRRQEPQPVAGVHRIAVRGRPGADRQRAGADVGQQRTAAGQATGRRGPVDRRGVDLPPRLAVGEVAQLGARTTR